MYEAPFDRAWLLCKMFAFNVWLQSRLMSEDYGKHLMGVDDLLQKHGLLESDIHVLGERVKTVNLQALKFVEGDFSEVGGW